ncbi:hypothetical protein A5772_13590 [Mycolicibacter sinensis]|uniref:Uncharacterized protein n=1 Tax=Mycolicibacter sinensis (strain JDM601) TaxID=875328 RepID=A0A1A2E720_MYCSD|nr:hypothetical protein A5772_13590 [Mycolicibacter sinensis]OBG00912.1 hypothetical protein A5771_17755 [Mycolicibacter sinensis]
MASDTPQGSSLIWVLDLLCLCFEPISLGQILVGHLDVARHFDFTQVLPFKAVLHPSIEIAALDQIGTSGSRELVGLQRTGLDCMPDGARRTTGLD